MKRLALLIGVSISIYSSYFYFKVDKTQYNKEINFSIDNKIKSFDPAIAFNDDSLLILGQTLETLFQYHYLKRPFEVIPLLADKMPVISSDGLKYRISIKKNVLYNNGAKEFDKPRMVQAQDFIWQIKRLAFKPLKSTGSWLFSGKLKGFDKFSSEVGSDFSKFLKVEMQGLKLIDKHTFEIHLIKPEPNLLYFLSMPFTSPIPQESVIKYKNDLSQVLIGSGPYTYGGYRNNSYSFKKFTGYHSEFYPSSGDRYANTEKLLNSSKERLPFIENVNFKVISDENEKWELFKNGEIDILDIPKKYLAELSKPSSIMYKELSRLGIVVKHFSRQTTRWLGFNMKDKVFKTNLNLRKAIAHVIDYNKYIQLITNNTSLRANSILNPSIPGYKPSHRLGYDFNLEKAKSFFKESGYKPGELTLTYSTRGKQNVHYEEAQFIQDQLGQLGIVVKIESLEFSEFLKKGRSGQLQLWTDNWIYDYPDAENLLQLLITKNHPGVNKSAFSDERLDKLYYQLTRTMNKEERFQIMYKIEDIVEEQLPWLMLMYESTYIAHHKKIKNFRKSFFIRNYVKYLQKL